MDRDPAALADGRVPGRPPRLDRDWLVASIVGGTLFATHQTLYFTALKLTTITNVSIIGALQPLFVLAVAGTMFDEHATGAAIAWSGLALAGTVLVVLGSAGTTAWSPAGDALAALNLFAFTAYFLASKRFRARVAPWPYVVGMTTVAGVVMLAVALATGQDLGSPHGSDWLVIAIIAVFPGTLGHVLTNWAHAHASAFVIVDALPRRAGRRRRRGGGAPRRADHDRPGRRRGDGADRDRPHRPLTRPRRRDPRRDRRGGRGAVTTPGAEAPTCAPASASPGCCARSPSLPA